MLPSPSSQLVRRLVAALSGAVVVAVFTVPPLASTASAQPTAGSPDPSLPS